MAKSTCCSYRGPGYSSQHPHGGSQLSVTAVVGDPMTSVTGVHVLNIYTRRQNIHMHKININKSEKYFKRNNELKLMRETNKVAGKTLPSESHCPCLQVWEAAGGKRTQLPASHMASASQQLCGFHLTSICCLSGNWDSPLTEASQRPEERCQ